MGSGRKQLSFDLFEAKVVEKKIELQNLMFRLADKVTDFEQKLDTANTRLENLQAKGAASSGLVGFGDGRKNAQQKGSPIKKTGMSVINPGSRKRKAPKGVQFK